MAANELVRVRLHAAGRDEIVRVSGQHVDEYLRTHPGAVVLDKDWVPAALRDDDAGAKAADKK